MGARVTPSVRDGERLQVSRPPDLTMMTIRLLSLEIQIFSVRASPFTSLTEEGGHVPVLGPRQGRGPAPPNDTVYVSPYFVVLHLRVRFDVGRVLRAEQAHGLFHNPCITMIEGCYSRARHTQRGWGCQAGRLLLFYIAVI